ncbi:hypothetical protein GCM10018966_034260 [Streptomyces yanii]
MLESWLEFHRATLVLKCQGLDDRQLRLASVPPSPMTLLGLVQHMAEVEHNWFQRVFAGQDLPLVYEEGRTDGFALALTVASTRHWPSGSRKWRGTAR